MAQIETWFNQDLRQAVKVRYIDGNVFSADNNGNIVGVNVFDGGEPATLGGTVSASIIRADGATVAATGTLSGNQVSVALPQAAYAVPGVISIVLKITSGTTVTTVLAVVGNVYQSTTDTVVDPGTIIPSVETLIAEIEAAVASIPADYSSLWTSLAPAYSTSSAYAVGQYVTYNGGLYRCVTAIESGESWTASHWTATNVGANLFDIKNALNYYDATSAFYALYGSEYRPVFRKNGQTIYVTPPQYIRGMYYNANPLNKWMPMVYGFSTAPAEMTVPSDYYFVFSWKNKQYRVMTFSDIQNADAGEWNVVLFYNLRGEISGDWKYYDFIKRDEYEKFYIGSQLDVIRPADKIEFEAGDDDAIIVHLPETLTKSYITPDQKRLWYYVSTNATTITVPNSTALVYDNDAGTFTQVTATSMVINNKNYIPCFFNQNGSVIGPWKIYWIEQKLQEVKNSIDGALPDYYTTYMVGKNEDINTILMGAPVGDSFIFVTDIHEPGNAMNSPALVKNILSRTSIDKVILGGDYYQQEASKTKALTRIDKVRNMYNFVGASTFALEGNHEFNTNGSISPAPELTWQEIYYPILKQNENKVVRQSNGLGYYWLNEAQKIKYMVATYNKAAGMDYASVKFVIQNLTNTPSGYTIVFLNHGGINANGTIQSGMDAIIEALDAVRNKGTYTLEGTVYDFSNADYTAACVIVGHSHKDFSYTSSSGMPLIGVTTDAYLYNEDQGTTRTLGTTSEQAFDVFIINTSAQSISTVRIGGGSNRTFSYAVS